MTKHRIQSPAFALSNVILLAALTPLGCAGEEPTSSPSASGGSSTTGSGGSGGSTSAGSSSVTTGGTTSGSAGTGSGGSGGAGKAGAAGSAGAVSVCPTVSGESSVSSPWEVSFIGTTCKGKVTQTGDDFEVAAVGGDIWGPSDAFTFVAQPFTATDGEITAKVTGDDNVLSTKVGVMFRTDDTPTAAMAFTYGTIADGSQFLQRAAASTATPVFSVGFSVLEMSTPVYVKTVKQGDQLTGFASSDGSHWLQLSTQTVDFGSSNVLAGIAVAPNNGGDLASVKIEGVEIATSVSTTVLPIPSDLAPDETVTAYTNALDGAWTGTKLGVDNAADALAAGADAGTFSITSVASDVWTDADGAGFIYQSLSGDFDVIAQVDSFETFFEWAKAGVMVRASLDAGAANSNLVFAAPGIDAMTSAVNVHGVCHQRRLVDDTETTSKCVTFMAGSGYLKLSRRGSTITSYLSRNGTDWFAFDSDTFAEGDLPDTVYAGVVASNHQDAMSDDHAGTALFSAVEIVAQ